MILNTQSFSTLVQNQAVAIQTKASALVDFTVGSVLRAVVEATSSVVLWLQGLILQVMALTRAATSNGSDLDTWMNDWGFYRLGASGASGYVTFARFTATLQAVVPVGAICQSADGSQQFSVILDLTNSAYSSTAGGFVIPAGVTSIACLVTSVTASSGSNVAANAVTVLKTPIAGVDYINNAGAFTGGASAEVDSSFRTRFWLYIAALRAGTEGAVAYAVASLQVGAAYTLTEDYTTAGVYQPGYFYVVVDDGTGTPPASLVSNAYLAIDAIRPVGTTFATFPPSILYASVSLILTTAAGFSHTAVVGAVGQAITTYINTAGLGNPVVYFRIAQIAMDTPGVTDISGFTLNGLTLDVTPTASQTVKVGNLSVS